MQVTMHIRGIEFAEPPFDEAADPRFLYLDAVRRRALLQVLAHAAGGRGTIRIVGRPGCGKSSLLLAVAEQLRAHKHVLVLAGRDSDCADRAPGFDPLVAAQPSERGRTDALLIDDADLLEADVLRRLSVAADAVILTATQPLHGSGASDSPAIALGPIAGGETAALIAHRLRVAGYRGPELFTAEAAARVARHGGGNPRRMTRLCAAAVEIAAAEFALPILPELIEDAAAGLGLGEETSSSLPSITAQPPAFAGGGARLVADGVAAAAPLAVVPNRAELRRQRLGRLGSRLKLGAVASVVIAAALLGYLAGRDSATVVPETALSPPASIGEAQVAGPPAPAATQPAPLALVPAARDAAPPTPSAPDEGTADEPAVDELPPAAQPPPGVGADPLEPPAAAASPAAAAGADGAALPPLPAEAGSAAAIPSTGVAVSGAEPKARPATASRASRRQPAAKARAARVMSAQRLLTRLGYDPGPIDGAPGPRTRAAVRAFQVDHRLPTDGAVSAALLPRLRAALAAGTPAAKEETAPAAPFADLKRALGFGLDSVNAPRAFGEYCRRNPDSWIFDAGRDRMVLCRRALAERTPAQAADRSGGDE